MVRRAALLLFVVTACAGSRNARPLVLEKTAPRKTTSLDPARFAECSTTQPAPALLAPTWQSVVLASDVKTWESGACAPLERSLTAFPDAPRSRQGLREECEAKSTALDVSVRSSCRAVCAAQRWLGHREQSRQRLTKALEWYRDELGTMFDRIEACPATRSHGNQLPDAQVRALFECAGQGALPSEVTFLLQCLTEPVSWEENGRTVTSARPIEVQWLHVNSIGDDNAPWRATVTRCRRGQTLEAVLTIE
ncbi:MAG: hypothetical protein Q8N26_34730 [Myxococcales bacterium]|nr:hypothetical protein [Myxococcales bacterium]